MKSILAKTLIVLLFVSLSAAFAPAQARDLHWRYVSLDDARLPAGIDFFIARALDDRGAVYGQAFACTNDDCDDFIPYPGVWRRGVVTVLQTTVPAAIWSANNRGTLGGNIETDFVAETGPAALFRGAAVKRIPPRPGEVASTVSHLTDSMALVSSFDADWNVTYAYYRQGRVRGIDFGPSVTAPYIWSMNNRGQLAGISQDLPGKERAFRFDPVSGRTTVLEPLPTEPESWGMDIDSRGDVLGYSYVSGGLERIGVWDRAGRFHTWYVEGTPERPQVSNTLLFNDSRLIVVSAVLSPPAERWQHSYVLPERGARADLADLVEGVPAGVHLGNILAMNERGDLMGGDVLAAPGSPDQFLLRRVCEDEREAAAELDSASPATRRPLPPALLAKRFAHLPPMRSAPATW